MGNNPVGKKVNTPKGKYLGKYLFTFGIRFLLEPYGKLQFQVRVNFYRFTVSYLFPFCVANFCSGLYLSIESTTVRGGCYLQCRAH